MGVSPLYMRNPVLSAVKDVKCTSRSSYSEGVQEGRDFQICSWYLWVHLPALPDHEQATSRGVKLDNEVIHSGPLRKQ